MLSVQAQTYMDLKLMIGYLFQRYRAFNMQDAIQHKEGNVGTIANFDRIPIIFAVFLFFGSTNTGKCEIRNKGVNGDYM